MAVSDLKKRLIERIKLTKNNLLLEELYNILEAEETSDEELYILSEEQQNAINEAREDIENGKYLTDEDAKKDIDEWLKK